MNDGAKHEVAAKFSEFIISVRHGKDQWIEFKYNDYPLKIILIKITEIVEMTLTRILSAKQSYLRLTLQTQKKSSSTKYLKC